MKVYPEYASNFEVDLIERLTDEDRSAWWYHFALGGGLIEGPWSFNKMKQWGF